MELGELDEKPDRTSQILTYNQILLTADLRLSSAWSNGADQQHEEPYSRLQGEPIDPYAPCPSSSPHQTLGLAPWLALIISLQLRRSSQLFQGRIIIKERKRNSRRWAYITGLAVLGLGPHSHSKPRIGIVTSAVALRATPR